MIKTHNITEKKYLCITKKDKWEEYSGSGRYWVNHLKKYGKDFRTELLYTSDDYEEFVEKCIYYSSYFDVVMNEEFANIIPEHGYGGDGEKNNFEIFWEYASDDIKSEIYKRRRDSMVESSWWTTDVEKREEVNRKISIKAIEKFDKMTLDERREYTKMWREGFRNFLEDEEAVAEWKVKLSISAKERISKIPPEVYSAMMSERRLNTSEESKQRRKEKIQALYATGKYDHLFEKMSEERQGLDNPNAKEIVWMGVSYTSGAFNKLKLPKDLIEKNFKERADCYKNFRVDNPKDYESIKCPHCGKESEKGKKPSSFKRWHFDNCRSKNT